MGTQIITSTNEQQEKARYSRYVPVAPPGSNVADRDPDGQNANRLQLVRAGWSAFDDLVRQQNRQIEENVRMVSGQHHSIFHPVFNRWLDVSEWMPKDEQRWRARAVINRILPWYMVTHARATENTPIVTFVPGPDRADAELAEVLDVLAKTVWWEANMEDVHDRVMGWVIVAGRAHCLSRINTQKGQIRKWVGEDMVPLFDHNDQAIPDNDGGQAHQMMQGVPFGPDGKPRAHGRVMPDGGIDLVAHGAPHGTPIGQIEVDVLSPMQVRGSWGPQPWHAKRVHFIRSFHPPEEVYEMTGVEVPPNVNAGQVSDVGELERLLFGTGFYNAASGDWRSQTSNTNTEGYVELTQRWEAPCQYPGMERTEESPGGRWTLCSPDRVLIDGPRPAAFPYTSPLNTFEFVRIPGRPGGTTPQEALNPVQRLYNDGYGRIRDHVNLSTNPKGVIDAGSGLKAGQFTNRPGENYVLARRPGVPAIEYVTPPRLGEDVYKFQEMLRGELQDLGFMVGLDPAAPGDSGEKLKEARFNTDRYMGPTMRRTAGEYGRMFETWGALYPAVMDMQTVISYAGDDNVARTITVYPEMFKEGKVHVRPDVESMLPEGRGERQEKVYKLWQDGAFGLPESPQALQKFWESIHMPHLGRVAKPGGVHRVTAEQENGQLLLGADPTTIPVYDWYDDQAHLAVHEDFMSSPEFKKLADQIKDGFTLHRQAHMFNAERKMAQAIQQQAAQQTALTPPAAPPPGRGGDRQPKKSVGASGADNSDQPAIAQAPDRQPPSLRPPLPVAPSGALPGGVMPTVAT